MHTSGSTGQPKGIMISHASLLALQQSMQKEYPTDHQDVWSCFHSLAFDVSLFEIWGALLTGARLVIASEHARTDMHEFHQNLINNQVSVLSQTPAIVLFIDILLICSQCIVFYFLVFSFINFDFCMLFEYMFYTIFV